MDATMFSLSIMTDLRPGPGEVDWPRHYREFRTEAALADRLGYRTIRIPESHGHEDGMSPAPLAALAGLTGSTERIKLMTYIIPLPLHRPREVVEQAGVVDLLSGGRLELGLGAGGSSDQFQAYGVDPRSRGKAAERALSEIRMGLVEGQLPDGVDGSMLPVSPPPARPVPLYYGGLSRAAVDRAVRLSDGCLPYDYVDPERSVTEFYRDLLTPALEKHQRTLEDFFFGFAAVVWVCDDPERDWATIIEPALAYRQQKYLEWAKSESGLEGMTSKALREGVIIGTPEDVAARLRRMHAAAPWHDLAFWYRLPGVGHDDAMAHLERVASRLAPLLSLSSP